MPDTPIGGQPDTRNAGLHKWRRGDIAIYQGGIGSGELTEGRVRLGSEGSDAYTTYLQIVDDDHKVLDLLADHFKPAALPTPNTGERLDADTIQTLLDLLNPLHGELDRQTYDERLKANFDAPYDAEYNVNITARMERDLTQAVCILEDRSRAALAATPTPETTPATTERERVLEEALRDALADVDENYSRFVGRELLIRNSTIDKMRGALKSAPAAKQPLDVRIPRFLLRGGPDHDYPCAHAETKECALYDCQKQRRCKDAPPAGLEG